MQGIETGTGLVTGIASVSEIMFDVAGETVSSWTGVLMVLGAVSLGVMYAKWVLYGFTDAVTKFTIASEQKKYRNMKNHELLPNDTILRK